MFLLNPYLITFFLHLHSSHTVPKISTLIPPTNNPYLALVSGGSQVYIVLHEEEADEHSIIKMFLTAWRSARYRWREEKDGKGGMAEYEGVSETEG